MCGSISCSFIKTFGFLWCPADVLLVMSSVQYPRDQSSGIAPTSSACLWATEPNLCYESCTASSCCHHSAFERCSLQIGGDVVDTELFQQPLGAGEILVVVGDAGAGVGENWVVVVEDHLCMECSWNFHFPAWCGFHCCVIAGDYHQVDRGFLWWNRKWECVGLLRAVMG